MKLYNLLFFCVLAILIFFNTFIYAQSDAEIETIEWKQNIAAENFRKDKTSTTNFNEVLCFKNAVYNDLNTFFPYFFKNIKIENNIAEIDVELSNQIFEEFDHNQINKIENLNSLSSEIETNTQIYSSRKQAFLQITFIPIRKNIQTNKYEKLISFEIKLSDKSTKTENKSIRTYAEHSVLKSGKWLKISVKEDGVYEITFDELENHGFTEPHNLSMFGNSFGMLPVMNYQDRPDDLIENSIFIGTSSILFYGKSPTIWKYDDINNIFTHEINCYSDESFYFLSEDIGTKKRIATQEIIGDNPTNYVNSFDDFQYHEVESYNLIKSGREWYGEHFDIIPSYVFDFSFPNLKVDSLVKIKSSVVGRSQNSGETNYFTVKSNNDTIQTLSLLAVNMTSYTGNYASSKTQISEFLANSDDISLSFTYNKPTSTSEAWLDYINLNVRRELKMNGSQMQIRDLHSVGLNNIAEFSLSNTNSNLKIWDITNPTNPVIIQTSGTSTKTFLAKTDSLKEFIAWDGTQFHSPTIIGEIQNQDLHGYSQTDMVIISHNDFLLQANQLAEIHRNDDMLDVIVVTPEQIYNEFSSGAPDVAAYRDFIKMFYDRATDVDIPKYLLLFGDGSYDNKSYENSNSNFILTYQSANSLKPTESYVSDDFFGLLDENEGGTNGLLDIGIGRLPVQTAEEAQIVIDKIISYKNPSNMGEWKNWLCFVADDEDNNVHLNQANDITVFVDTVYPNFNIEKIFLDSYVQISTPAGERYPDVNLAIKNRVKKGSLIFNYTGHGNELGLAHEQIININDIMQWDNSDRLPLFMTATCEFSRFDDWERTSAGELVLLNAQGGGIALFTTTRLVYSTPNYILNQNFYETVFSDASLRLGDVMRMTKIATGTSDNKRNFALLGDPALKLALPEHDVNTISINDINILDEIDTLKALSKITISGEIVSSDSIIQTSFNGKLYSTIFDKETVSSTLGNDGGNIISFKTRNNTLYKGIASINNGEFKFSFIVPKDIAYNYDFGKISYYAKSDTDSMNNSSYVMDASGYFNKIIIGGSSDLQESDNSGPKIELFMNDTNFVNGGITDENPILLAVLADSNGINTVGNGIGHDLTAIIDDNTNQTIVLNDYYLSDIDSYQSGKIEYFLFDLEEGIHNIVVKVWDVYNNSSEKNIEFLVADSYDFVIKNLVNYPNPFNETTSFYFEHNHQNGDLDVEIEIFNMRGQLVKTINKTLFSGGFSTEPIEWNGSNNYGNKLTSGIYIYKVNIQNTQGYSVTKSERLVIMK
jgi:hypothetical protein